MMARSLMKLVRPQRCFTKIEDNLELKRRADEERYINKRDKENLKKLLAKMDQLEEIEDTPAVANDRRNRLLAILNNHSVRVSEKVIEDLLKWKKGEI